MITEFVGSDLVWHPMILRERPYREASTDSDSDSDSDDGTGCSCREEDKEYLTLDLSNNTNLGTTVEWLCQSVERDARRGEGARELRLSSCGVRGEGLRRLSCCAIEFLDLSLNPIGRDGAEAVAGIIAAGLRLRHVRLSMCRVDAEGAEHLAGALAETRTLRTLDVSYNRVGDRGAGAFARQLADASLSFAELDLACNGIGEAGAGDLADALHRLRPRRIAVDLASNYRIGPATLGRVAGRPALCDSPIAGVAWGV